MPKSMMVVGVLLAAIVCRPAVADDREKVEKIDRAMAAASSYLASRQGADGAWRSEVYPPFRDGASLTPLVLRALQAAGDADRSDSISRGVVWLVGRVQVDGQIDPGEHGLSYPVYTAANAVIVLGHPT